jgi:hypothetical protein
MLVRPIIMMIEQALAAASGSCPAELLLEAEERQKPFNDYAIGAEHAGASEARNDGMPSPMQMNLPRKTESGVSSI